MVERIPLYGRGLTCIFRERPRRRAKLSPGARGGEHDGGEHVHEHGEDVNVVVHTAGSDGGAMAGDGAGFGAGSAGEWCVGPSTSAARTVCAWMDLTILREHVGRFLMM